MAHMAVYTDNPRFAAIFLPLEVAERLVRLEGGHSGENALLTGIFGAGTALFFAPPGTLPCTQLLLSERSSRSQYDQLIHLSRTGTDLSDGTACLAGSGSGFHGFKGRAWAASPGNIHLSLYLVPGQRVDRFGVAFTILASLSVVEALDQIAGLEGEARIKWVNDILLGEAKIGGVLAYTQSLGDTVTSAVLGIGINVEVTPGVDPTPFVPRISSVREYHPTAGPDLQREIFLKLLEALERNYRILLEEGLSPLLDRYRDRSMVVGRQVTVCTEASDRTLQVIAQGRVSALGENLELYMDGLPDPIRGGRLVLGTFGEEARSIEGKTLEVDSASRNAKKIEASI